MKLISRLTNLVTKLSTTFIIIFGIILGMALSDLATLFALPHGSYMLQLVHEETRQSDFICARTGLLVGQNISTGNIRTNEQDECFVMASGVRNIDGSFDAYPRWETWYGRWVYRNKPVKIPASDILSTLRIM